MQIDEIELDGKTMARCCAEAGERIDAVGDFLDLMGNCAADTLVLDRDSFDPRFFELRSGLAGEILQKVSNYRRRLVVLGDFSAEKSRALRDFIYESNRTGQVVFAPDLEAAAGMLR